jgi:hypothetical protein
MTAENDPTRLQEQIIASAAMIVASALKPGLSFSPDQAASVVEGLRAHLAEETFTGANREEAERLIRLVYGSEPLNNN